MIRDYVSTLLHESMSWMSSIDQHPLIGGVIRGEASRGDYVAFLRATYHYVRETGPLLAATAKGLHRRGDHPWLIPLVDAKTAEESPHHRWALADLEQLGEDVEAVRKSKAPRAVRAYVEWSLCAAEAGSPGFLGIAFTLELISARRAWAAAANLSARAAIPNIEKAVSFLDGRGYAESDHVALLSNALRRIEDPRDQASILLSAAVMRDLYPRFFRGSRRHHD